MVENCSGVKPMRLFGRIIEAQKDQGDEHKLLHIRAVNFDETFESSELLDSLANIADGSYSGVRT